MCMCGVWHPDSLAIMFASALLTNTVLYYAMLAWMKKPVFAPKFSIPCRTDTPAELFVGSALFGAGWGLGGFCPGPAIVASWEGNTRTLVFLVAMVVGMGVYKYQRHVAEAAARKSDDKMAKGNYSTSTATLAFTFVFGLALVLWAYYDASSSGTSARVARNTFYLHPYRPLIGGVLIGTSVASMMALSGEILGISGILSGLFSVDTHDKSFRAAFLAGLLAAAAVMWHTEPGLLINRMHRPLHFFALGGLLVGFGTGLGSGCTSGHGVAGLTRMSKRSIIAVAVFMSANIAVTTALHTIGIGTGWKVAMGSAR